jgi:GNAT superfamily N-acetyltransferase
MNSVSLRTATPADSEFAYRVKKVAFGQYIEQAGGWDEEQQRQLHAQRFGSQDFQVISQAGIDAGIMVIDREVDCIKVNQLFILPEHQGRKVGRQCMLLVMDEARRRGLPVRLRVMKVNPRARVFYERLGFKRTGEIDTHDLMEWQDPAL